MASLSWIEDATLAEVRDITASVWQEFLQGGGPVLFQQMLREVQSAEQLSIELKVESFQGKEIPEEAGRMILMHAAIKTLVLTAAFEAWRAAHEEHTA